MSRQDGEVLIDPLLAGFGIEHGFGRRGSKVPPGTVFPKQVHGKAVHHLDEARDVRSSTEPAEADAIMTSVAGASVGIVTADCVPILAAAVDGSAVAAIHAGWRGLAAGMIEAGLERLRQAAPGQALVVAVGPAARGCCYEVDEPVRSALASRYGRVADGSGESAPDLLSAAIAPGRAARYQLDLSGLAALVIEGCGVESTRIGLANRVCTICDGERFESYRRDGASAGRLRHFISRTGPIDRSA